MIQLEIKQLRNLKGLMSHINFTLTLIFEDHYKYVFVLDLRYQGTEVNCYHFSVCNLWKYTIKTKLSLYLYSTSQKHAKNHHFIMTVVHALKLHENKIVIINFCLHAFRHGHTMKHQVYETIQFFIPS